MQTLMNLYNSVALSQPEVLYIFTDTLAQILLAHHGKLLVVEASRRYISVFFCCLLLIVSLFKCNPSKVIRTYQNNKINVVY